jgi:hypothetical protein
MDLSRIDTVIGLLGLCPIVAMFAIAVVRLPLGAISLPCITMMTGFTYFYLIPVVALAGGDDGYFGMYISEMEWMHFAVLLYNLGAIGAFFAHWRVLNANPEPAYPWDRPINNKVYLALWGVVIAGVAIEVAIGRLNITGDEAYQMADYDASFLFLTQTFSMTVPLTVILLIRGRFSLRSLAVLALVLVVLLQVGFRVTILMLLAGAAGAFALQRGFKIGILRGAVGFALGLLLVIVIGAVRRYGQGIDLAGLTSERIESTAGSFAGELSVVYAFDYITANPLPAPNWVEPWVVGISRLVPSFLWPDKPTAEYLSHVMAGAAAAGAESSGTAPVQHVEILFQFGWWGLLPMAFCYFWIAGWLVRRVAFTGRETRLAGCVLIPFFFGYYMQSRGYFFQILAGGLFVLGPLFILSARPSRQPAKGTRSGALL